MPSDVPLSSKDGSSSAFRVIVKRIADDEHFGRFSLRANQVPPFSVFLPLDYLAEKMELKGRVNVLLVSGGSVEEAGAALAAHWKPADIGLRFREVSGGVELVSDRVFLDPPVEAAALAADVSAKGILSYFVNGIIKSKLNKSFAGVQGAVFQKRPLVAEGWITPYSFVSAPGEPLVPRGMGDDEIIINQWLAADLGARVGDEVTLAYFVPGEGNRLEERVSVFRVRAIVPIEGLAADEGLMPEFPGLSDAENCRDWDPGIPIDLDRIREKDESYWETHRGTPKAFVTLAAARRMWSNRFGALTSVRYVDTERTIEQLEAGIMQRLEPGALGLQFRAVRDEGIRAGSEAVDFGQLFIGLSFFIIVAALLLTGLLFVLGIEQRAKETGILTALGYRPTRVNGYLLLEGAVIAFFGSILGALGGILYNQVVLFFLGTLWRGAVGTSALHLHLEVSTLLAGTFIGFAMAVLTMALAARKQVRRPVLELLGSFRPGDKSYSAKKRRLGLIVGVVCFVGVLVILGMVSPGKGKEAAGAFWGAGFLMLTGCLGFCYTLLLRIDRAGGVGSDGKKGMDTAVPTIDVLGRRNTARKRGRSLAVIALLSFGIFIVIAVGANRHGILKDAEKRSSGTGGFAFYGETTLPVLKDLNEKKHFRSLGLEEASNNSGETAFVQLRLREGDDASCLNLNRISNPRILGVKPEELSSRGAFSFVKKVENINVENPWLMLKEELEGGVIPAAADQTVIIWGLGKKVGDVLTYKDERGRELKLKLVAGLSNSIFQGSVIISEKAFISHFPTISGSRVLLIDAPVESRRDVLKTLSRNMQDYGPEITSAADRLAAFNMVQDTYLSIFLALGGLGLILGTIGMGVVVLRNVMERRSELALLRAVGFSRRAVNRVVLSENFLLLILGAMCGAFSAVVAVLPAILSPGADIPYLFLSATLTAVVISGGVWVLLAVRIAVRGDLVPALRNE
jgi:ABC-type antimicrobial peptide transport system permease subunit